MLDKAYSVMTDALAQAVAGAPDSPHHQDLLETLRSHPGFEGARIKRITTNSFRRERRVLDTSGRVVHANHNQWLADELQGDSNAAATFRRLQPLGLRLSYCEVTELILVVDREGRPENFVQLLVHQENEFVERRLFSAEPDWWRSAPENLRELISEAERGDLVPAQDAVALRPKLYGLYYAIDIPRYLRRVVELSGLRLASCRAVRMFNDWSASSAGRSGARFCDHFVLYLAERQTRDGDRWLELEIIPTIAKKIGKVENRHAASDYTLYGKLEHMSGRLGVPFGWFFLMLHGRYTPFWAGTQMRQAVEAGLIVLPEHDYRVLKSWDQLRYGF